MTAKEARDKAFDIALNCNKQQYDEIMKIIENAVNHGELMCYYYSFIRPVVLQQLKNEGYAVVISSSQKDGVTVTISW